MDSSSFLPLHVSPLESMAGSEGSREVDTMLTSLAGGLMVASSWYTVKRLLESWNVSKRMAFRVEASVLSCAQLVKIKRGASRGAVLMLHRSPTSTILGGDQDTFVYLS